MTPLTFLTWEENAAAMNTHHRHLLIPHILRTHQCQESGKHEGNRKEQDRQGSHCHGTNSLGGIRYTKPLRKYQNDRSYDNKPGYDEKPPRSDSGLDGEVRPWEVKLKPRTKSQKTSEDQREGQCKGPFRERSLYWSSLQKGSVWL